MSLSHSTASQHLSVLWILLAVWITTAEEEIPCPQGGLIHLASLRCFWMSATKSSWFEAQDMCRKTRGGDLASAESKELLDFIHNTFPQRNTAWVWLRELDEEKLVEFEEKEPKSPPSEGVCFQLAMNIPVRWRRSHCVEMYNFICENQITEFLPSKETYLTGLVFLTGVYTENKIDPLQRAPDIGQNPVEMMLFPGLWFSHAGRVVSVELVVQPSAVSSLARVQILRPYCSPNHHLVPPGCSSVLNAFSFCSAVPLCNTTGGCSVGHYWCHLLEDCVPNNNPCSTYSITERGRRFTSPPRYPTLPPFYHLVTDLPLTVKPSPGKQTLKVVLPVRPIEVFPDDIVALQHTLDSGKFVHCVNGDNTTDSPWRQSYLSFRGPEWGGWWEEGLTLIPKDNSWVDGVVCDLRILYVDTNDRATEHKDFYNTHIEKTTTSDIRDLVGSSKFQLHVIYPLPDENNQIHVQINVPTPIVVKALFGEEATSTWSAPIHQTGVPFHPFCPQDVIQSAPDCKAPESWFSSATLISPTLELQTLSISVRDADSFQSVSVNIQSYEAVTGLHVEPHQCLRILTNTSQIFKAKVKSGSSVKFTWLIHNMEHPAHKGESYSVMFKQPAEYKLQVTAANRVSSQSQQILLTADEMTPLTPPEFLLVSEVVPVNDTRLFAIRAKADVSLPLTFRWNFGDGSADVIHTHPAPCQTIEGHKKGEKQVYVQDSLNHTYSTSGVYTVHVQVSNQYDRTDTSLEISVRPPLESLFISSSSLEVIVKDIFQLEALAKPSESGVVYTWDFDDGSKAVQQIHCKISYMFESPGEYNISVSANNGVNSLSSSILVLAVEKIAGLVVAYNKTAEAGSLTNFTATVASGTDLMWDFDFGDASFQENLTDGSISHIYRSPGRYKVAVTVHNLVSQAHQSITVEVYSLIVNGIHPTECVLAQDKVQFTALVNGNVSTLSFHWVFERSPPVIVVGQSVVTHTFQFPGTFHVNLTVFSSVRSVSFCTNICVETPITSISVESLSGIENVAAIGEEVCFTVSVSPNETTSYQFTWFSNSSQSVITDIPRKCFVFRNAGFEELFITASNKVSNKTARVNITIQQPVSYFSVSHDIPSDTLLGNTSVSFWVSNCTGSNVSVVWNFGDGSLLEWKENVSHVFTSAGKFMIIVSAFNAVSRNIANLTVDVVLPVLDLSLHTRQPFAVVGEESLFTAVISATSGISFYWRIIGLTKLEQHPNQFRFTFPKPGVYNVSVIAKTSTSEKKTSAVIEVFERIEDLHIDCKSAINQNYLLTQEETVLFASVTKGSNVTYSWVATHNSTNEEMKGNGERFYVMTKIPGTISIKLTASNILGEVTTNTLFVAVERVTQAHIENKPNTVALGKAVNISLSVKTGSDLKYFWYIESNFTPVMTLVPFLVFIFTNTGHSLVTVSVQNVLSQSNDSKLFLVQEEVQKVDFLINKKKPPFFFNASVALYFQAVAKKGNELYWNWKVKSVKETIFTATGPTFTYSFQSAEIFQVYLNVSNEISWQMVSQSVTTQEPIQDLWLNISKTSVCTGDQVIFTPKISKGSNVSFVITFQNEDWIQSQDISGGRLSISSLPAGKHQVTIKATNQVNSAETASYILVTESIQGLQLVNCCSATLEALNRVQFKAEVQEGFQVNYTWIFHSEGFQPIRLTGQEVSFTPPGSGLLSLSVLASNNACSQTLNETVGIEWPVKNVQIVCHAQRIFVGYKVRFSATVTEGTNVTYLWDFGNSTEELLSDSGASYIYHHLGKHVVEVKAFNNVSLECARLQVDVEELLCSSPQVSLIQKQSIIFKSRQSFFEASVKINCSAYKTSYQWEVFRGSCSVSESKVDLGSHVGTVSPLLLLPKQILDVGSYCLVFAVSFRETPLIVERKTNITVVPSMLVAVIKGGSHRLWPTNTDLILDGSKSHDPDMEFGVDDTLQYNWTCLTLDSTESPCIMENTESKSRIVIHKPFHAGKVYVFTLTVSKKGKEPVSVNQMITMTDAPFLPVTIKCRSCSVFFSIHHISNNNPLLLVGQCDQCDDQTQYKWSAEDQNGITLELGDITTSTGSSSPNLVVPSSVLQPGRRYSFALNVSKAGNGQWGRADLIIQANNPPHHGSCDLSPEEGIYLLETAVTYNCSGWRDDENGTSRLIYTLRVALCQTSSSTCPVLTLYRGTRSTFSTLVPFGSPRHQKNTSIITVYLQIEDHQGAKLTALNRTLTVINPEGDQTLIQWLKNKSQKDLRALVQQGNPQEIIPYAIALTTKLNQMEHGRTYRELADMKEIWENITEALTTLPMSTLQDVDQLSSALMLSTNISHEFLSKKCQEAVLDSVGKMIHVMKQKMTPVDVATVEMGENILSVLGGTMAALSQLSPDRGYGNPLQAASTVTLSALGHAEDIMGILMRSRVRGEDPLLISTKFIKSVGFFGDPTNLLCTDQSNQIKGHKIPDAQPSTADKSSSFLQCPFVIPNSLSAHLKSQMSEVVQMLLGIDEALDFNPLLTAADPPISTSVVAMKLTTPQGLPIPIQDLNPKQAIKVTLANKHPTAVAVGSENEDVNEDGNETCLTVTLPTNGQLNFSVKVLDSLNKNAGLYISFNFSLAQGAFPVKQGHVKTEVVSTMPADNASQHSLVREWALTLSTPSESCEKTIFLSPLLNGRQKSLLVNLTSSLVDGGGPVTVLACVFSSLCQYYSGKERRWSSEGLYALEGSTLHTAHCLTQHLTLFGASLFVHPGAVVLLPPPSGDVRNMMAGILCAVLVVLHLLLGLVAYKLDHLNSLRLSQVPLCGRSGCYQYRVLVKTGWRPGAGTTAHVGISLHGVNKSGSRHLQRDGAFQRSSLDQFQVEMDENLGEVWKIRVWHDNTGLDPSWYVQHVVVWVPQTDHMFFFLLEDWLSVENPKNQTVEKEVLASCPDELTQFRRVFISQLLFGMAEHHLWLSLWEQPTQSSFTRVQRVTCCILTLHLYLVLGTLWYGAVGADGQRSPVSAHLLVNMETVAVGLVISLLVFPFQSLLCFLFSKTHRQVSSDVSLPPSPVCHSVEMDVFLDQSEISGSSFLQDSSGLVHDSPTSLLESEALNSSLLDFWTTSGLVPQADVNYEGSEVASSPRGSMHQLKRKKALMQLHSASPFSFNNTAALFSSSSSRPVQVQNHRTALLSQSDEDLITSIAAEEDTSKPNQNNSDSGRDSQKTISSLSATPNSFWSSWSEEKSLHGTEMSNPGPDSFPDEAGLYKCLSEWSVDSLGSTSLPGSSYCSTRSTSATRLGVARRGPGWLFPSWVLCGIYPLVAAVLVTCLVVVGLYGSFFSQRVVLMWLASTFVAFFTSVVLLEPFKVCVLALVCTTLWRPVDPEVEGQLAQEATVVRVGREPSGAVRPPCGYGLLQAKEEARRVRALRSLMMHCVSQMFFLLLVLMVNYQDVMEQRQGRLLHSTVRRQLHTATTGSLNLTSLRGWSDTEQWITHILVPHLHQNPNLYLVGLPQLQHMDGVYFLGNNSGATLELLADMNLRNLTERLSILSVYFTHYHKQSGLFICVSIRLETMQCRGITSFLSINPLLIPSSSSVLDLHVALTIFLFISALFILLGELWSMLRERAKYLYQCYHWSQLFIGFWTMVTAVFQLCFLSHAFSCASEMHANPNTFISFHRAAHLAETSKECSAVLLTLLLLKMLGILRFVRRWVMIGRVLQKAWRELWAAAVLLLLQMLLCTHLGNTLFFQSVEGFQSEQQSRVSVLSILCGLTVIHKLCRIHPVLGPFYGLLLIGGCFWLLARLCGAVLVSKHRLRESELPSSTFEPQDYEMVDFFMKRLKLWMGITKTKEFRHRVKFEGMALPPSRSSQDSFFSTLCSTLPSSYSSSRSSSLASPCPPFSDVIVRSEDSSISKPGSEILSYMDNLDSIVNTLLSRFDQVNQLTDDIYKLEVQLEEAQVRRRNRWTSDRKEKENIFEGKRKTKEMDEEKTEVRQRKVGILCPRPKASLPFLHPVFSSTPRSSAASPCGFPRVRNSCSESEAVQFNFPPTKGRTFSEAATPTSGISDFYINTNAFGQFPRRRAWHSGSSHSADAAQRALQFTGVSPCSNGTDKLIFTHFRPRSEEGTRGYICDGVPMKKKAWISEEQDTE